MFVWWKYSKILDEIDWHALINVYPKGDFKENGGHTDWMCEMVDTKKKKNIKNLQTGDCDLTVGNNKFTSILRIEFFFQQQIKRRLWSIFCLLCVFFYIILKIFKPKINITCYQLVSLQIFSIHRHITM